MTRIDFTQEKWFSQHKNTSHSNLLLDLVDNFDYLQAFGENSLDNTLIYLGEHNYADKLTGYIMNWDGRHLCDRCGAALDESGSARSVKMAYAKRGAWLRKSCGLCDRCDKDLDNEIFDTSDSEHKKSYWNIDNSMPNDWNKYAWL